MRSARLGSALLLVASVWSSAEGTPRRPTEHSLPFGPNVVAPVPLDTLTSMPPDLTVTVEDPDADSLIITFYGRPITTPVGPDFTLVEIPDTQYYSSSLNGGSPAIFEAETGWIAAQRAIRNIAYVGHVGDIVENGENGGNPSEWLAADAAMRLLEDPDVTGLPEGIPFGVSAGNHDLGLGGNPSYNQYFGVGRFAGRSYYGGHRGGDNNNWFDRFSASGLDFIVLGLQLEYTQDPGVLHWADSLLTAYSNRRAIIVSHYLLDPGPPQTTSPRGFSRQGQAIYDGLKNHTNLILMICGHYVDEMRRSDTYNGHTIHTVMANYQNRTHGGDGWLRIMEFSPARNQIRMRTYSPTLEHFEVDADSSSQFTLDCDLSGGDGGFHPIGTFRGVPSGSTISIPWAGLQRGRMYEWYVEISDGSGTVDGPPWQFHTTENIAPLVEVTAPNGGEALTMGQRAVLEWSASDPSGIRSVDVLLSRNGSGGPWSTLISETPNTGSFNWWVTGPTTNNAYVRIVARDTFYNEALDVSDGPFQVIATTGVGDGPAGLLALDPVAPNPTRGPSHFGVVLPVAGRIALDILDVSGRRVAALASGYEAAGRREFAWDGRIGRGPAPAGLYFARLEAAGRVLTRRFAVAR
jgi:hypothetical protein